MLSDFFSYRLVSGEPLEANGLTITPVSRALTVQLPGMKGGLIWNRPAGIRVNPTDLSGNETYIPIVDITRILVWGIAAIGLAGAFAVMVFARNRTVKGRSK